MTDLKYIPMESFPLKWRFTSPSHRIVPPIHLVQIKPLAPESAGRVRELQRPVYFDGFPLRCGVFQTWEVVSLQDETPGGVRAVRKWLYLRGIPFSTQVFLSYGRRDRAIETTWKVLVKYWDDFWYPGSDDVLVTDASLLWALFFWHEREAFFGDNRTR